MGSKYVQVVVEFLRKYGWICLVVLLAIGGLAYVAVSDNGRTLPDDCSFKGAKLACGESYRLEGANTNNGELFITLQNNADAPITITSIRVREKSLNTWCSSPSAGTTKFRPIDGSTWAATHTLEPKSATELEATVATTTAELNDCGLGSNVGQKKTFDIEITFTQDASTSAQTARGSITTVVQ